MEEQFWQNRWATGKIGFHEDTPNAFLQKHLVELELRNGAHVFVPLCGKTTDLDWLLEQGFRVTGVEFNRGAIEEVFDRLSLVPVVKNESGLTKFTSGDLTLWHGDFFMLTKADVGSVDAVYDRAALVALPDPLRKEYASRLVQLSRGAPQLLISFDYDQSQTDGPPFSVPEAEIDSLYHGLFDITLLSSTGITGPLAKRTNGLEQAWKLTT